MISSLSNVCCVLWPRRWSVLVNASCELEKNVLVYSAVVEWSIDFHYIQYPGGIVEINYVLLTACFLDPSMSVRGLLKSPTMIMDASVSLQLP